MDVRLPDGTVIRNIPDGTSKADLVAKLKTNGYDVSKLEAPEKPVAGSQPLPSTGERLQRMGSAAMRGAVGGPMGVIGSMGAEGMSQFGEGTDRIAHNAGETVSQAIAKTPLPAEVAGAAGYLTNVGMQAIPALGGGGIGKIAGSFASRLGEPLMRSALKPSKLLGTADQSRAVDTMLNADVGNMIPGANVTSGGIGQIFDKVKNLGGQVQDILGKSPAMVKTADVADALEVPLAKFRNQVTPSADLADIVKVEEEFLRSHPNYIPIKQAHDLKQGTYKVLGDKAFNNQLKVADIEAQKALASGLRKETEKGAPEIAPLNAEQSDLLNAVKVAISRDAIAGNRDPISLGFLAAHPMGALGFMANRSELIKSQLARLLAHGSEAGGTGIGATLGGLLGAQSGKQP